MKTFVSDISKKEFPLTDRVLGRTIQSSLFQLIQEVHPDFTESSLMALSELNEFREKYILDFMEKEATQLSDLQSTVLKSVTRDSILTAQLAQEENEALTWGQRISDVVASFGGSWKFILSFLGFLLVWITANGLLLAKGGFDPYPFILLNLILSSIAALQAPIIMMSQNRQEEKDRDRSRKDYMINLKSELEIRLLHEKIDHLMLHQQLQLIEVQKMQMDMMNEIMAKVDDAKKVEADKMRKLDKAAKEGGADAEKGK
jgi:uncharacterized membrane protein